MPMLDAFIPEGALAAEAETRLLAKLTDILLPHEGADPMSGRPLEDGAYRRDPLRVWVFATEVPDGTWGSADADDRTQPDRTRAFVIGGRVDVRRGVSQRSRAPHGAGHRAEP